MRTLDVRIDVIRNGAKVTELIPDGAPVVRMDQDAAIKSSMSGSFRANSDIDILQDEIRPVVIIDGMEHPCGLFAPATVTEQNNDTGLSINIEAYDRCWRVQGTKTEGILHLASGSNYITVIKSLLMECGIALVIETPTTETLRMDREDWQIGTDYLTIINTLLDEINYYQLWFDNNGYAVLQPEQIISADTIVRTYDGEDPGCMVLAESAASVDLYDAPNVFICVCSNPDDNSAMVARATNNNPASPLSVIRRGRRICKLYKVENIASQSALNDYAQLICQDNMMLGESISVNTALMPECGMGEVVAVNHKNATGMCFETAWEMELQTGGIMRHTLKKVVGLS